MLELVINNEKEKKNIMLIENGVLVERHEEHRNKKRLEGNIYIGKVKEILPGMQSAFIDIGEGKNTFIRLKDLLPKIDETKENYETNNVRIQDIIKKEQKIMVQIKRDETMKKGARVSRHINISRKIYSNFTRVQHNYNFSKDRGQIRNIKANRNNKKSITKEYWCYCKNFCKKYNRRNDCI